MILFSERQSLLIELLSELDHVITGRELADLLGVSPRTLRYDISRINGMAKADVIEASPKGYLLNRPIYNDLVARNSLLGTELGHQERILLYFFNSRIPVRKVGFGCSIAFALLFVLSIIFAMHQKSALTSKEGAIIMAPAANLKKTPIRSGADEAVLHEGTRVDIADRSIKGWLGVKLADGREGWIEQNTVEEI